MLHNVLREVDEERIRTKIRSNDTTFPLQRNRRSG
jgi:hypothetical protein